MIEQFAIAEFEQALPVHNKTGAPLWHYVGMVDGERAYMVGIRPGIGIMIRSSIDYTGFAASTGENSIRCWLVDDTGRPLGSKVNKWTTREKGWELRLLRQLRTLWTMAKEAGDCPNCHTPKGVYKAKSGQNKGRIFAKCFKCDEGFTWLSD